MGTTTRRAKTRAQVVVLYFRPAHNKALQSDQDMLSCLLLAQESRQHVLVAEERRYALARAIGTE